MEVCGASTSSPGVPPSLHFHVFTKLETEPYNLDFYGQFYYIGMID